MPHDNDLRVADAMGDAAIASEIPEFNLDEDIGEGAGPHHDDPRVIDVEVTTVHPNKRKKIAIIAALTLVAILVVASFAFLRRGSQTQQPQNPDLAAIIQEAKTIPPSAAHKLERLNQAPIKNQVPVTAQTTLPSRQSLATTSEGPIPAADTHESSNPAKAASASNVAPAASVASPIPPATAATSPFAISKADYDTLVSQRDAIAKELDKAKEELTTQKSKEIGASPKQIVKLPERVTFTVKAVLADGVVLQNADGKSVIAPNGARVTVEGKAMAVSQ